MLQVCLSEFQKEINYFSDSLQNGTDKEKIQDKESSNSESILNNINSFKNLLYSLSKVEREIIDKENNQMHTSFF